MTTYTAKPTDIKREWYLIDAAGKTLGRLSAEVAKRLRGKHKPQYTPHLDSGDYIVVINARQIKVTGNKAKGKRYYHHSGYPGGIKSVAFEHLHAAKPERIIKKAVYGMLPKGPLGRAVFRKLKVYADAEHKHAAQQPKLLEL